MHQGSEPAPINLPGVKPTIQSEKGGDCEPRLGRLLRNPAAPALAYLVIGWLWVLLSESVALGLASNVASLQFLEEIKGAFFVTFTAALLYLWLQWVKRMQDRLPLVETQLRDSEIQIAQLMEYAPDAVLLHDARRIHYANPAFFRLLEIPRTADVAKIGLRDITDPDDLPTMMARIQRLSSDAGIAGPTEVVFRSLNGGRVEVEHASCSVRVGGRMLVQSHLRDLTDRNQAWRELQRWNDELESRVHERTSELSAVNKALESFTYSVAHDLRSPVGRMNGFATVLLEACERQDFSKIPHYARRVADNARVMGEMIDGMLMLSRADRASLTFARIDTARLVRECISQLDEPASPIEVRDLPCCKGDALLVREIWVNLIANALKYSAKSAQPRVVVSGEEVGGQCRFCVADNGIGFDPSEAGGLFRTFHRLPNAQGFAGTGIGLSIVQRIVTRHGGRVWAQGTPGKGAQFCFTLPACREL